MLIKLLMGIWVSYGGNSGYREDNIANEQSKSGYPKSKRLKTMVN